MSLEAEVRLLAVLVGVTCALPGTYLVLRKMALLSDAISHTILLGIVLVFFWVRDLASPLLIVGAAATGVFTVFAVEALQRTGRVKEDAAIALVFPALFALAVLLISRHAGQVHLDTDAVILGEILFAPLRRLEWNDLDLGPVSAWVMGVVLLLNLGFLGLFQKEMKVATFDPALAASLGFSPVVLHYGFMSVVSVTAVGAFDAVGSIVVVALMIAPPATARLLSNRLSVVLGMSAGIGALSALLGYQVAAVFEASVAGSMAMTAGLLFGVTLVLAPERGILSRAIRRRHGKAQLRAHGSQAPTLGSAESL
jgi:manganese/zinc/iron transport system permease protein